MVAELGGPGGFVPLLLTYIFSVGSDRCFRRFAVSMGRLFPLFWGLLGGKKLLKPDGTMAFYKHDGSTLGFSVMFQGYTVYSRYTYYIDSKHLYKKCSLMGPLNEGHVFMKFQ